MTDSPYFTLDSEGLKSHLARERAAAQRLRATHWWRQKIQDGECAYCHQKVGAKLLTLDHRVPLARGGRSTMGNCVPACRPCNQSKGLQTPVEMLLRREGA